MSILTDFKKYIDNEFIKYDLIKMYNDLKNDNIYNKQELLNIIIITIYKCIYHNDDKIKFNINVLNIMYDNVINNENTEENHIHKFKLMNIIVDLDKINNDIKNYTSLNNFYM